jgi:hypothetical protein
MLVLLLAVIASVCFAVAAGVYLVSAGSGADRRDALPYFAITLATLLVGVASIWEMAGRSSQGESLRQRADRLTTTLQQAMASLAATSEELQREAEDSKRLVAKLEQDASTYEELARINRAQAEAVAHLVRGEIEHEGRRSLWRGVAVNFVFFLFGMVLTLLVGRG